MEILIYDFADRLIDQFFNPEKRVFVGYLASALMIAICFQVFVNKNKPFQALIRFFCPKIWWSRSGRADYITALINQVLMMGMGSRLISKLAIATLMFESLHILFDGRTIFLGHAPTWLIGLAFTLGLFLLDDLTKFLLHRCLHTWPVLWCFHKVHHTAETLTPFTVFRTHPVEALIFAVRAILVQAIILATFFFFLGDRIELTTVFGANIILVTFHLMGANLRHSHVQISYGVILERILISPAQHQIHHSIALSHTNQNFGAVLAIWDWISGSLILSKGSENLAFGVEGTQSNCHTLKTIYLGPFQELLISLKKLMPWRKNDPVV